jgi:hypothetical protein
LAGVKVPLQHSNLPETTDIPILPVGKMQLFLAVLAIVV